MLDDTAIIKYIDSLDNPKSFKDVFNMLLSICDMLKDCSVLDIFKILELNSQKLTKLLESFYKQNKKIIESGKLEDYVSNPIFLELVEGYCELNNININIEDNVEEVPGDVWDEDIELMFLKEVSKLPLLSALEEKELFKRYKNNDLKAKEEIVRGNIRLVVNVAKRNINKGVDLLDLIQEGNIGLMKAVENYCVHKNSKFSTFAIWYIRTYIQRALIKKSGGITLPFTVSLDINKMLAISDDYSKKTGADPDNSYLSKRMNKTEEEITKLKKANILKNGRISLNDVITEDEKSELGSFIPSPKSEEEIYDIDIKCTVEAMINNANLKPHEKDVIKRRYGISPYLYPQTLREIAKDKAYGYSAERICTIEQTALRKLQHYAHLNSDNSVSLDDKKKYYRIFTKFSNYSPELLNELLMKLEAQDLEIIDSYNRRKPLDNKDKTRLYKILLPKIEKVLSSEYFNKYRDCSSIYEIFSNFDAYSINKALSSVAISNKKIITKCFGVDFKNGDYKRLSFSETVTLYTSIIPGLMFTLSSGRDTYLEAQSLTDEEMTQFKNMLISDEYLSLTPILSSKSIGIFILKFVGINGKVFDDQVIAGLLDTSIIDVLSIIKKDLPVYNDLLMNNSPSKKVRINNIV